jgi:hypothetical protein
MKEQIRELLNVCGMPNEDLMDIYSDPNKTFYMEKFAESIVRECAEVAGCNGHVSGFSLGDLIKQHFGVEQTASQKMAAAGYTRRPRGWTP